MWRYLIGGVAALLAVAAGWLLVGSAAHTEPALPGARHTLAENLAPAIGSTPALPQAPARDREQKRFDRYDKDRDGRVTREEYLASRRKVFAKLDTDGDGRLGFDEWSIKTTRRFGGADRDRSNSMDANEFAATAPKRKAPRPACRCAAASPVEE